MKMFAKDLRNKLVILKDQLTRNCRYTITSSSFQLTLRFKSPYTQNNIRSQNNVLIKSSDAIHPFVLNRPDGRDKQPSHQQFLSATDFFSATCTWWSASGVGAGKTQASSLYKYTLPLIFNFFPVALGVVWRTRYIQRVCVQWC